MIRDKLRGAPLPRVPPSVESAIEDALSDLGFRVHRRASSPEAERVLLAKKGSQDYAVQIRRIPQFRREAFRGAIADAILSLAGYLSDRRVWKPLLCIWLDRASPGAASELEEYISKHGRGFSWLLLESSGRRRWSIDGSKDHQVKEWDSDFGALPPLKHVSDPFSPGGQWMLKLLLLPGLEGRYWSGPSERPSNVSELAYVAQIAQSHASNFVASLESQGYLRRERGRFHFPDIRRLIEDWAYAARSRPRRAVPARPIHPEASRAKEIDSLMNRIKRLSSAERSDANLPPAVVGHHHACRLLGLSRSNVDSIRLYVREPLPASLKALELLPAEPGRELCEVVQPRERESIFRCCVKPGGVAVSDVMQCYLDVKSSPARGEEQAQFIFERVLEPHFRKLGWL